MCPRTPSPLLDAETARMERSGSIHQPTRCVNSKSTECGQGRGSHTRACIWTSGVGAHTVDQLETMWLTHWCHALSLIAICDAQLFRALMRKEKPIEAADASAVAAVHVAVTDNTWQCIMEYEKLHEK